MKHGYSLRAPEQVMIVIATVDDWFCAPPNLDLFTANPSGLLLVFPFLPSKIRPESI